MTHMPVGLFKLCMALHSCVGMPCSKFTSHGVMNEQWYALHCRCMACDRPLAKLDPDMGGFIPGPHMPISVTTEPSKNNGVVVLGKDGTGARAVGARRGPPPSQHSRTVVHAQSPRSGTECAFVNVFLSPCQCFVGCAMKAWVVQ